jgi:hypothetical protein
MRATGSRLVTAALISFSWPTAAHADEKQPERTQLAKLGKAATAVVEVDEGNGHGYGYAFCIHESGLFVTNEHVVHPPGRLPGRPATANGKITLVVSPGQKDEKSYTARVARADKQLDLAFASRRRQ